MTTNSKTQRIAADNALISGLQKHASTLPASFNLAGQTYTSTQCVTTLQGRITVANAVGPANASYQAAVKADTAAQTTTDPFVAELKAQLLIWFKNDQETLADFGLTPSKRPGTKDPLTKVVAAEKLRATRKARGTMGKREREEVKGSIPSTLSITVSSSGVAEPEAVTAASAPAGSPPLPSGGPSRAS
jgi:hypothetical protein